MDEEVKHASHKVITRPAPGHINSESTNNRYLSAHTSTTTTTSTTTESTTATTDSLKGGHDTKSSKSGAASKDTRSSQDTKSSKSGEDSSDSGLTHNKHGTADDPHMNKDGLKFNVNGRGFPDVSAYGSNFFVVLGGRYELYVYTCAEYVCIFVVIIY